ncbi:MAG: hypothetical protein PHW02_05065 [bacterium]|nr:hypothetical protein [bacterium]
MKKRFFSAVFGFLLVVSMLSGCFFMFNSSDPNDITDWYTELPVGTVLTYQLIAYVNGNTQDTYTYTETVMSNTTINGVRCMELYCDYPDSYSTMYILVDTEEGIIARSFDQVLDSYDNVCFITPVSVGTSWDDSYGKEYEIKHVDSYSSVDAGEYNDIIAVEGGEEGSEWYEFSQFSKSLNTFVFNRYDMILGSDVYSDHVELISID